MRAHVVIVLVLSFIAAATAADFLDGDIAQPTNPVEITTKKFHRVTVNKTETVKDDMGSKYRSSTSVPIDVDTKTTEAANNTTEIPITTSKVDTSSTTRAPKVKTTTSAVPIDDHTTTETAQTSTSKSSDVAPVHQSHFMRWVFGGLFVGIFVVILSLYAYKFYRSRSESTYQNL